MPPCISIQLYLLYGSYVIYCASVLYMVYV